MAKSIKQRLADKVNKDLHLSVVFEAKDFQRNYGSNRLNDWCSWTARAGSEQICSFTSMTELVNMKEPLSFVGNKKDGGEIT